MHYPGSNTHNRCYSNALLFGIGALLFWGCARSMNPDVERGTNYQYESGHPEVRLSAIGFFDEQNNPIIDITADIVYGSLFFKRQGNKRRANLAIELRIFDRDNDDAVIMSRRFSFDQVVDDPEIAKSQDVFTLKRNIPVDPGDYEVELTVIDQNTRRRSTRVVRTQVPSASEDVSSLTNIRMFGKRIGTGNDQWDPITTYNIPGKLDSLKFVYQMINKSDSAITINSRLLRFKTDTSVATPMDQIYNSGALTWGKGIDYNDREVIQSNRRVLVQEGNVSIEYYFSTFPRGNYRFEVDAEGNTDQQLFKARDFSVKSEHYPTLKTPRELARPLIYLMNRREYDRLISIQDPDSLKQAVDRFWLMHVGDRRTAKSVIELYYQRVEEANKKFTNFKEGWKTDRGMIYILFGEPWYVNEYIKRINWSYTYNLSDPNLNFTFREAKVKSEFFPFDYYVLDRRQVYYTPHRRQVQLWLSGQILIRKL